mmetsp:Transcript_4629/g.7194  ORF Transcript_4629/g.7194 Transcript_4629/m.7194 type:complete len:218 (-) Transcript_4629:239-892(-)
MLSTDLMPTTVAIAMSSSMTTKRKTAKGNGILGLVFATRAYGLLNQPIAIHNPHLAMVRPATAICSLVFLTWHNDTLLHDALTTIWNACRRSLLFGGFLCSGRVDPKGQRDSVPHEFVQTNHIGSFFFFGCEFNPVLVFDGRWRRRSFPCSLRPSKNIAEGTSNIGHGFDLKPVVAIVMIDVTIPRLFVVGDRINGSRIPAHQVDDSFVGHGFYIGT